MTIFLFLEGMMGSWFKCAKKWLLHYFEIGKGGGQAYYWLEICQERYLDLEGFNSLPSKLDNRE